jgi:hypothetical protein
VQFGDLIRELARRVHVGQFDLCAPNSGLTRATSARGLGSPHPPLHRDRARPSHICAGTVAHSTVLG